MRFRVVSSLALVLTLLLAFTPLVNAHTALAPYTVPFVLGATNIPIGFIRVWNDPTNLYVLFEIDHDSYPNYAMSVSHLEVSKSPLSWSAPGGWTYSHVYSPYEILDLYTIPLSSIDSGASPGTTIYLMAHGTIYDGSTHVGSAYGLYFKGSFQYTIQEKPPDKPALSIVKTGPMEAYPGGTYLYTIVVTNVGNCPVDNVIVVDQLPSGVVPAYPAAPGTPTGTYDSVGNKVTWNLGTMGLGAVVTITLEVVFTSGLTPCNTVSNEVSAEGTGAAEVEASWETHIIAGPKLSVEKVGPTKSYPDGLLVYTIKVSNIGSATAYNVVVKDTIDLTKVEYVSSTPVGTVSGNTITWILPTPMLPYPTGEDVYISLTVKVKSDVADGTVITDNVEVRWKDSTGQNYGPETYEWITTVYTKPLLTIVKTGPLYAHPGGEIEYKITVVNIGGSKATNVKVIDKLPVEVEYISANPPGTYDSAGHTVTWDLGVIEPGGTVDLTVKVKALSVSGEQIWEIIDKVEAQWSDEEGGVYPTVKDEFVTLVSTSPLLKIDKAGDQKGMIGETLSLTISVTNVGGSAAKGIEVVDDLPYGLTLLSSNPLYSSYDSLTGKIIWNSNQLGTINPSETKVITLIVKVDVVSYDGIWVFNNVYANWYDEEKNFFGPVSDIHPIQLFVDPYAELSKSGPIQAYAGSTITYTITLTNPTISKLSNVELTDLLPARVTYISSTPPGVYDTALHTIKWNGLEIEAGETLTFQIKVSVDSDLPDGALILDEAIVTWPDGSDTDTAITQIKTYKPPPPPPPARNPVGGKLMSVSKLTIIAPWLSLCGLLTLGTLLLWNRRSKRLVKNPKR
ncbi:MAG: hypothetical protein QXO32_04220 [Candidatus Bathyarchaeia archaeon]